MSRSLLALTFLGLLACRSADTLPSPADPPAWPTANLLADDGSPLSPPQGEPDLPQEQIGQENSGEESVGEPDPTEPAAGAQVEEAVPVDPSEPTLGG